MLNSEELMKQVQTVNYLLEQIKEIMGDGEDMLSIQITPIMGLASVHMDKRSFFKAFPTYQTVMHSGDHERLFVISPGDIEFFTLKKMEATDCGKIQN